jgi:hypothetical protein
VARIVKQYATRAGLDPSTFAAHSLRAGFLTSAAEHGASVLKLMEVSRHRSVDTLRGYVRRVDSLSPLNAPNRPSRLVAIMINAPREAPLLISVLPAASAPQSRRSNHIPRWPGFLRLMLE